MSSLLRFITTITLGMLVFLGKSGQSFAFPDWETYRLDSSLNQSIIDTDILKIISRLPAEGFVTKRIRFCTSVEEGRHSLWETSLTASCHSTEKVALKHQWPPVVTSSNINFTWVAYSRLIQSFCRENQKNPNHDLHESCTKLGAPTDAKFSTAQTPGHTMFSTAFSVARLAIDLLIPFTRAESLTIPPAIPTTELPTCKFTDGAITSKDGITLFVDFGVQPSEQHAALLSSVATAAADDKTPESVIRDGLAMLRAQGHVLVRNYQTKIPWIQERVSKDKVSWIAVEQTEAELGDATGTKFAKSFDAMKSQLVSRKTSKEVAHKAMTVGACPSAPVCHWLQHKTIQKNIRLVAIDSDSIKTQGHELRKTEAAIFRELEALVTSGKLTKNELSIIRREITNIHLVAEPPDQKTRNRARQRFGPREASDAMVKLYDGVIAMKKNANERERAIAEKAFAQKGNGILSFAPARRDSIIPMLESVCRGPEPTPTKPPKNSRPTRGKKTAS